MNGPAPAARPLRIALVTPGYPPDPGGVETYVSRLARTLAELGHRPTVFTQTDRNTVARLGPIRIEQGVRVHRYARPHERVSDLPAPGLLTATRRRWREFDVVHTHSYHQLPALGIALSESRLPIVTTLHYNGQGRSPWRRLAHRGYRPLGRLLLHRAAAVIALSNSERTRIRALAGDRTPISVIAPGIDSPPDVSSMPVSGRTILGVGRLERGKRFDLLIDALPHLPSDVRLVVAGVGPEAARLRARAEFRNVAGRVELPGWLDSRDLARRRAAATVFASASDRESFHMSLVEALARGLPAVASAIPAHRDAAALPNARVVLVSARDARSWADALRESLALPHAEPISFATWPEVAGTIVGVYRRAIDGSDRTAGET